MTLKSNGEKLELNETNLSENLSDIVSSVTEDLDHYDLISKAGNEFIVKEDGSVLTIEEFHKEMDDYANIAVIKMERYDDEGRVRFYYKVNKYNDNCTVVSYGVLWNREKEFQGELTPEEAEAESIFTKSSGNTRARDINGAIHARFWIDIQYGNHIYRRYNNTIHTSWEELGE